MPDRFEYEGRVEAEVGYDPYICLCDLRDADDLETYLEDKLVELFSVPRTDSLGKLRIVVEQIEAPVSPERKPRHDRNEEKLHPLTPEIVAEMSRQEEEAATLRTNLLRAFGQSLMEEAAESDV